MRRISILLLTLLTCNKAFSANLFLKAAGGAWSAAGTWSTTGSGGADNSGPPAATTDAILEAGSGALTIDVGAVGRSLDMTSGTGNYTGTITHNAAVTLTLGDGTAGANNVALNMAPLVTYNLSNSLTSAIKLASTSATKQTITSNGRVFGNFTIDGVGSYYTFADSITQTSGAAGAAFTINNGILDTSSQAMTMGSLISGVGTKTFTLISSTINVNLTGTEIDMSVANTVMNATRTTINLNGVNAAVSSSGGKSYYDLNYTGSGALQFSGGSTIHNFVVNSTGNKTDSFAFTAATYTINGALTLSGNSVLNRLFIGGSIGTNTTYLAPVNGPVTLTNVDFRDIQATQSTPWAGTSVGDGLGNFNITFTAPVNRYVVSAGGKVWSDGNVWSNATGGSTGFSVPLPQDGVFVDANSGVGTFSADMPRIGMNIDFTGYTGVFSSTVTNSSYGNLILAPGMTFSGAASNYQFSGRGVNTINSNGIQFPNSLTIINPASTYTLVSPLSVLNTVSQGSGANFFASNGHTVTCSQFSNASGSTTDMSSSTWNMTRTAAGNFWTASAGSTILPGGSNIILAGSTANSRTFQGAGKNYGTLTYIIAGSAGTLVISGANSFDTINFSNTSPKTLTFPAATVTTIRNNFNVGGTSAGRMTINSSASGSQATLSKTSGQISTDWLSIQDSNATGGAIWYAGANSSNVGNNTGWIFSNPPSARSFGGMISIQGGMVTLR